MVWNGLAIIHQLATLMPSSSSHPSVGSWSRSSSTITGRRPWARDTCLLDYAVDSEAEWEQDEEGEVLKSDDEEAAEDDESEEENVGVALCTPPCAQ